MVSQCLFNELGISIRIRRCASLAQSEGKSGLAVIILEFHFLLQALYFSIFLDLSDTFLMNIISNLYWDGTKLESGLVD